MNGPGFEEGGSAPDLSHLGGVAGFFFVLLLYVFRGLLLWIVVPLTAAIWLAVHPIVWIARRLSGEDAPPRFSQWLWWVDNRLVAVLTRSIIRPFSVRWPVAPHPTERAASRVPFPWTDIF